MSMLGRIFGLIIGLAFGLIFSGAGVYFLNLTSVPTWKNWQMMQGWQAHEATIVSLQRSDNDTKALYKYKFSGVAYQNDRVYVAAFKDNIGSYHEALYQRLYSYYQKDQPIPIWVDSKNPAQAVIDREMRWGLFGLMAGFCALFILIGLVVIYASIRSVLKKPERNQPTNSELRKAWQLKKSDPDYKESFFSFRQYRLHELKKSEGHASSIENCIDWTKRKGWQTKQIASNAKSGLLIFWVITVVWNAISSPLLFAFQEEWKKGNYAILLGLLFPVVGAAFFYHAIRKTLEYLRFGKIIYEMDPYPGAIGGHIGGTVVVNKWVKSQVLSANPFKVTLECVHSYVSGSGKNRSRNESIRWAEEGEVLAHTLPKGFSLTFRFDVPAGLPESDVEKSDSYCLWRLKVEGRLPGIDLARGFEIPVFKTGETTRFVGLDISEQHRQKVAEQSDKEQLAIRRGDFHLTDLGRRIQFKSTSTELKLHFPMFRQKMLTVFALIFAGGFGFASYSILVGFGGEGWLRIFLALFSIPFVLVAVLAIIASIYLLFGNFSSRIDANGVRVLYRLLFIPVRYRRAHKEEINKLSIKRTGSTGQGAKKIEHFKILVHRQDGSKFTLASDIDGELLAGHFKDFLAEKLQVTDQQAPATNVPN